MSCNVLRRQHCAAADTRLSRGHCYPTSSTATLPCAMTDLGLSLSVRALLSTMRHQHSLPPHQALQRTIELEKEGWRCDEGEDAALRRLQW